MIWCERKNASALPKCELLRIRSRGCYDKKSDDGTMASDTGVVFGGIGRADSEWGWEVRIPYIYPLQRWRVAHYRQNISQFSHGGRKIKVCLSHYACLDFIIRIGNKLDMLVYIFDGQYFMLLSGAVCDLWNRWGTDRLIIWNNFNEQNPHYFCTGCIGTRALTFRPKIIWSGSGKILDELNTTLCEW